MLEISLAALCGVVIVESLALRAILQEILALRRIYLPPETESDSSGPQLGTAMPSFRARLLDAPDVLTDDDLRGRSAMLLFVAPASALSLAPGTFAATISALWNKVDGCLCVICNGDEQECRLLRDEHQLRESYGDTVRIVVDEQSDLLTLFNITSVPSAVMYDEDGYVHKTGRPVRERDAGPIGVAATVTS